MKEIPVHTESGQTYHLLYQVVVGWALFSPKEQTTKTEVYLGKYLGCLKCAKHTSSLLKIHKLN